MWRLNEGRQLLEQESIRVDPQIAYHGRQHRGALKRPVGVKSVGCGQPLSVVDVRFCPVASEFLRLDVRAAMA
jgi:hypothetical protein